MPVLKAKINGVWQDVAGMSTGNNADTLDGKHADEFAAASDVEDLKELVGNTSVSDQINEALAEIPTQDIASKVFVVEIDHDTMTANYSGPEIKAAHDAGQCVMAHYLTHNYILAYYALNQAHFTCSIGGDAVYALIVKEDKSVTFRVEIASISEIIAEPGQIASVKTVDVNGHPTEWEAVHLRHTKSMDFSSWSDGRFYESLEGLDGRIEYRVEFDENGRPIKITHGTHSTEVVW